MLGSEGEGMSLNTVIYVLLIILVVVVILYHLGGVSGLTEVPYDA